MLSTITSSVFCEFVLEFGKLPPYFNRPSLEHWGHWDKIDRFLEERFGERRDFRLIIRTGKLYNWETFQRHAKKRFPLLTRRGRVLFETSHSIEEYWR
ncbi:hypothetical protein BDM02DRAFT_693138 [Thelephora ganbajun]|uniref:Uncharacterized protein n=1 Tax=Thelephora ganbajun TaxID=370292 RepID=A0ACB6Z6L0_THEGA|nr:hypothetical protein BDM02DRAFT_693138 [Thelephora ganbajun]